MIAKLKESPKKTDSYKICESFSYDKNKIIIIINK